MRRTCDFERFDPPALTEKSLRRELARREQRKRTVLLALAGTLLEVLLALLGLLYLEFFPALGLGCICSAIVSMAGSGAVAIVFVQKGGSHCENRAF